MVLASTNNIVLQLDNDLETIKEGKDIPLTGSASQNGQPLTGAAVTFTLREESGVPVQEITALVDSAGRYNTVMPAPQVDRNKTYSMFAHMNLNVAMEVNDLFVVEDIPPPPPVPAKALSIGTFNRVDGMEALLKDSPGNTLAIVADSNSLVKLAAEYKAQTIGVVSQTINPSPVGRPNFDQACQKAVAVGAELVFYDNEDWDNTNQIEKKDLARWSKEGIAIANKYGLGFGQASMGRKVIPAMNELPHEGTACTVLQMQRMLGLPQTGIVGWGKDPVATIKAFCKVARAKNPDMKIIVQFNVRMEDGTYTDPEKIKDVIRKVRQEIDGVTTFASAENVRVLKELRAEYPLPTL